MEMFDDPEYQAAQVADLRHWAFTQGIDWAKSKATIQPWRAFATINNDVRLIAVGSSLKQCLWMAKKLLPKIKMEVSNEIPWWNH